MKIEVHIFLCMNLKCQIKCTQIKRRNRFFKSRKLETHNMVKMKKETQMSVIEVERPV